ncbi:MAG: hypothetical protein WKF88_12305 [Ferruginibacter sp.]
MDKLSALLRELEHHIKDSEKLNLSVSAAPVGWHIEHTMKTFILITQAVKHSKPEEYRRKFNATKLLVFTLNRIPRGRAKAPESVRPVGEITAEKLIKIAEELKHKLKDWEGMAPDNHFDHPYFGKLNVKATIKFLKIHTKHHLKIIQDITKGK